MDWGDVNPVGLIAALLGAGGLGAVLKDVIVGIVKAIGGMSIKTEKRKMDIVEERDEAVYDRDKEAKKRRILEEAHAELRRWVIERYNVPQAELPPWPKYDRPLAESAAEQRHQGELRRDTP